jgi:hypothetical protein
MQEEQTEAVTAERVARNDAIFREANEGIRAVAAAATGLQDDDLLPFLCECADVHCTEIIQLTAPEYEAVRSEPTRFVKAHGHVRNAHGWARVVEERDRYTVAEKVGEAAAIAAELDPRAEDE